MGKIMLELVAERTDMSIVAGVDQVTAEEQKKFPVFQSIADVTVKSDVIIDFTHHSLTSALLDYVEKTKTPAVICTTGLDEPLVKRIEAISKTVPILRSGNMSLGINLLLDLVKRAAPVLAENFDIEIIEKHHNRKLDAPSGTAYMLADAINQALGNSKKFIHGREGKEAKRQKNEIGIHAVRGGTIVGEHSVIFAGPDEVIEIHHSAASRKVFGAGAIKAALFLVNQKPGLYTMKDVLKE
jgi:4-hydroxy-tetrahydrodipicolinate reductase